MLEKIIIEEFPKDNNEWLVIEHSGTTWNNALPDEPLVEVILLKESTKTFITRKIGKSYTVYVKRGSVWVNGNHTRDRNDLAERTFNFHVDKECRFISAWEWDKEQTNKPGLTVGGNVRRYYIPPLKYPIPKSGSQCQYLMVTTTNGVDLIVSSLAIFDGMYGHSNRAKQVAFSYDAERAQELLEFKGYDLDDYTVQPALSDYVIGLNKDVYDRDVYFLYHLKESMTAQRAVNFVSAQLESAKSRPCYLKVRPWYSGSHKWKVSGLWLVPGKRFLALRILKFRYPQTPPFFVIRQNNSATSESHKEEKRRSGGRRKNTNQKPVGASEIAANSNMGTDELFTGGEVNWGETTLSKAIPKENKTKTKYLPPKEVCAPSVSSSNLTNSHSEAGRVNIIPEEADTDQKSQETKVAPNAIMLLLKALQVINDKAPAAGKFSCLTSSMSWASIDDVNVPGLFNIPGSAPWNTNRSKLIHEIAGKKIFAPRRLGLFHLELNRTNYFFIAIERFNSERFRSSIYKCDSEESFASRVVSICDALCAHKGVWKNLSDTDLPEVGVITHKGDDKMIAEQIMRKIFGKL